jgi:hypothetical protein
MKRVVWLLFVLIGLGALGFIAAQFGDATDARNTRVSGERSFEKLFHPPAEVMTVLRRSCFDCHSQETRWPWYSHIPVPGSELGKHIANGRREMNFSEWNTAFDADAQAELISGICETTSMGMMPLKPYVLMHPQAAVSEDERKTLCAWTAQAEARLTQTSD